MTTTEIVLLCVYSVGVVLFANIFIYNKSKCKDYYAITAWGVGICWPLVLAFIVLFTALIAVAYVLSTPARVARLHRVTHKILKQTKKL